MPRVTCLIGLGSNEGDRRGALDAAVGRLQAEPSIRNVQPSRWYETEPIGGPGGQLPFLNGAVRLQTDASADDLLTLLKTIESDLGRRRTVRWGPRTLDLDLLLYGERTITTDRLTVPHPRMAFRRFVLEGAAEVAVEMVHPTLGRSVGSLWEHLNDAPNLVALAGSPGAAKSRWAEALGGALDALRIGKDSSDALSQLAASTAAGSAGPAWDRGIQLHALWLEEVRGLAASAHPTWTVSEFFPGDLFTLMQGALDAAKFAEFQAAIESVPLRPLLNVMVGDSPSDASSAWPQWNVGNISDAAVDDVLTVIRSMRPAPVT